MQLTINLPERVETIAQARHRWDEAISDPIWLGVEGKFESNSFGQMIVTPPPPFSHNDRAYRISTMMESLMAGHGRTEVPIATIDGIKVPDAAWFSDRRFQAARGQSSLIEAPEICVEVLSPKNTDAEMAHKRHLYFDAGAIECWMCDLEGRMSYYTKDNPEEAKTNSTLCPDFLSIIED